MAANKEAMSIASPIEWDEAFLECQSLSFSKVSYPDSVT